MCQGVLKMRIGLGSIESFVRSDFKMVHALVLLVVTADDDVPWPDAVIGIPGPLAGQVSERAADPEADVRWIGHGDVDRLRRVRDLHHHFASRTEDAPALVKKADPVLSWYVLDEIVGLDVIDARVRERNRVTRRVPDLVPSEVDDIEADHPGLCSFAATERYLYFWHRRS